MPTTKRKPQRTCLGCKQKYDQDCLLRVFREPGGRVLLYEGGTLIGRTAYMCANLRCVEKALAKDRLARALKKPVAEEAKAELFEAIKRKLRKE